MVRYRRLLPLLFVLKLVSPPGPLEALVEPQDSPLQAKEFRHSGLWIGNRYLSVAEFEVQGERDLRASLSVLGVPEGAAFLDPRTGRWGTLMPTFPLLPGDGVGNTLTWEALGEEKKPSTTRLKELAWQRFVSYLDLHKRELDIDVSELSYPGNVTVHDQGELIQIHAPRIVKGIPVQRNFLTAVINHGNLILFGAINWGNVELSSHPTLSANAAASEVRNHLAPLAVADTWQKPKLAFVPLSVSNNLDTISSAEGLTYRLVWVVVPVFEDQSRNSQAFVDAHTGELLLFEDTNQYGTARTMVGGVFPVSNDGVPPDGVEIPDYPMPYADVFVEGQNQFTDSGGNMPGFLDGTATTTLNGQFVKIEDSCGEILESSSSEVLDLQTSIGTDCTTPAGASPGNTHAARTAFYELNRIREMARGQLPNNAWLQSQLTARTNINYACGAFWDGSAVNFGSSGKWCANSGELASIFGHEFGHGLDANDGTGNLSNPAEGIADIYAALRLNTSCIGRGFLPGVNCPGFGDPCLECDGVRDIDWEKRESKTPHDIAWIDRNCGPGTGPCGRSGYCESVVVSESVWDFWNRDLRMPPFNMDFNTALELTTYLTYRGANSVGEWYQCSDSLLQLEGDGCNSDGGYLNYLAADDDDGNLTNGTPHMSAIFGAFERHGIACDSPTVQDSISDAPTTAPIVTATPQDRAVHLEWAEIPGASSYRVYQTEGQHACEFGKALVSETVENQILAENLQNGREYFFIILGVGSHGSSIGSASQCIGLPPVASGPKLIINAEGGSTHYSGGDNDVCADNGEELKSLFTIINLSNSEATAILTKYRTLPTRQYLGFEQLTVPPAPGFLPWYFTIPLTNLQPGQTLEYEVCLGVDCERIGATGNVECDQMNVPFETYSFENMLNGWTVHNGTFSPALDGADGSDFSMQSSMFLNNQCDDIRSPLLVLKPESTMSLWTNFDIEPINLGIWKDRANVSLIKLDGNRVVVQPDGGRTYNANNSSSDSPTGCNYTEDGWAGTADTWASSSWSSKALDIDSPDGELVQFNILYGTHSTGAERGFWFDQMTLHNFDILVPEAEGALIFADGFELGDLSAWSTTTP